MSKQNKIIMNHPYKELSPYLESDASSFKGRTKEIEEMYESFIINEYLVCHADSGEGKTSIIEAGLIPKMKTNNYFPIRIVFRSDEHFGNSNINFDEVICKTIDEEIEKLSENKSIIVNRIYPYRLANSNDYELREWEKELIENNAWLKLRYTRITIDNLLYTPVLIFDQFEEVFSNPVSQEWTDCFFAWLKELSTDLCPQRIISEVERNLGENDFPEIFTHKYFKAIFSLRSEYVGKLDYWGIQRHYIPLLKNNRYLLRPLTINGAREVIVQQEGYDSLNEIANDIVDMLRKLQKGKNYVKSSSSDLPCIPALLLSIVCSRSYNLSQEERILFIQSLNTDNDSTKESAIYDLVAGFYQKAVDKCRIPPDDLVVIEDVLVNSEGNRQRVSSQSDILKSIDFTNKYLKELEKVRLIRIIPEYNREEDSIELVHDALCPVILKKKEQRRQEELLAEQNKLRISRNREYNIQKRANNLNVLTPIGRRLLDNSLDFGEFQTLLKDIKKNFADRMLYSQCIFRYTTDEMFKEEIFAYAKQEIFKDPLLSDVTYRITFQDFKNDDKEVCTSDGIYAIEIKYNNSLISDISFYGKDIVNGTINYDSKVYIYGGYCSIHIDYDEHQREIRRTYLGEDNKPTINMDGYSIIETSYDVNNNPVKIRYFKIENDCKVPCAHNHGNYGFDSEFDEAGNEIFRYFVNQEGETTTILSGVYGKKMEYNTDSFLLTKISNIDRQGRIMPDIDGYATIRYEYDESGRQYKEIYYDTLGKKWKNSKNIYGSEIIYNEQSLSAISYNINENDEHIEDSEGICGTKMYFNAKHTLSGFINLDINGDPIAEADGVCEQRYGYDALNRLNKIIYLNQYGHFVQGYVLDFNKNGIHVVRMWNIDAQGKKAPYEIYSDKTCSVYAFEFDENEESDAPLIKFINNQYKSVKCNSGYYAFRRWCDNRGRLVKALYYDEHKAPMCDNEGTYGYQITYVGDDESKSKVINIGKDHQPIETSDGVCYFERIKTEDLESEFYYDKDGNPSMGKGYFGYKIEKREKKDEIIKITSIVDEQYRLINDIYLEEIFDKQNRLIRTCKRNSNQELVMDEAGYYVCKKKYSDDGKTTTTIYLDENGKLCNGVDGYCKLIETQDDLGRPVSIYRYDNNNAPCEIEDGIYGMQYEYPEVGATTMIYLGEDGRPKNNSIGVAYEYIKLDAMERIISHSKFDQNRCLVEEEGHREFVNRADKTCAYYIFWTNSDQELSPAGNIFFRYQEEDTQGRITKIMFLDKDKRPICDEDGDYGEGITYHDEDNLEIHTYLDAEGNPHNNNKGYSVIKRWYNANNQLIKEQLFTVDGKPFEIEESCYGYIYEHLSDNTTITGFLDELGNIHNVNDGYAYIESISDDNSKCKFYYDVNKQIVVPHSDELGDYGKKTIRGDNGEYEIGLDECGNEHINNNGYFARVIVKTDDCLEYHYENENYLPVRDDYGDYFTIIKIDHDGLWRKFTSLNNAGIPHNNYYGYAVKITTTDVQGQEISMYYDRANNQVIPHVTIKAKLNQIKRWFKQKFAKIHSSPFAFNPRQIGAVQSIILVRQEGRGLAKQHGLKGTYVLLRLMDWKTGDGINMLVKTIKKVKTSEKRLLLLPICLNGSNVVDIGDVVSITLPKGKMGFRFVDWKVNRETLEAILGRISLYNEES